jgi:acylphosphatase
MEAGADERLTAVVRGWVQGVGFRWWVQAQADRLRLAGHARNLADGGVEVVAEGPRERLEQFLGLLQGGGARRPGHVDGVTAQWSAATGTLRGFGTR